MADITKAPVHPNEDKAAAAPRATTAVSRGLARRWRRWQRLLIPYLFISPFLLGFIVFLAAPDVYALVLSFYHYAGYGTARFVGWQNYIATLHYPIFWAEIQNTLFYWLAHTLPLMVGAFGLALLVRSKLLRGQRFFKPIIFMPQVIAIVAASLIFQNFFSTEYGVVNSFFHTHIPWLEQAQLARWIVVVLLLWRGLGFWFVIFVAGLASINPDLEEAAVVDGASSWQRLRFVTLPLLRPVIFFAFILDAIGSMRLYTEPNVLTAVNGPSDPSVAPILSLLVSNLNNGNFGQSAAVGWLLFALTIAAALAVFGVFRATGEVQ